MKLTITLAILFVVAAYLLIVGLRGLFTRRPVVYPARNRYWMVVLGLTPAIVSMAELIFDPNYGPSGLFDFILVSIPLAIFAGLLIYMWWELSGYTASGVTRESFRNALHPSLEKLNLPYKDWLTLVELNSIGAQLQASFQPWRGAVQLKVKPGEHKQTLRDIAQNMNQYYKDTPAKVNHLSSILDIAAGVLALGVLIYLTISRVRRGV